MKRIISLLLVIATLLPGCAVFAQNSEAETGAEISMPQAEVQEADASDQNIPEPVMTHEEASQYRTKMERFKSGISLMSTDDDSYSEIVFIETAEQLMALNGHKDGYYELLNDIDFSGIALEPIYLENATLNGNGFALKNMTLTDISGSSSYSIIGGDCYVTDLTLLDFTVDVQTTRNDSSSHYYYSPIYGYLDTCELYGNINIITQATSGSSSYLYVQGINSGYNSIYIGDIYLNDSSNFKYGYHVDTRITGILNGNNCTFSGDIKLGEGIRDADAYGICTSNNCIFEGNISAFYDRDPNDTSIRGIYKSSNCTFSGDIYGHDLTPDTSHGDDMFVVGISSSNYCVFFGNIYNNSRWGRDFHASALSASRDCAMYGDVTANYGVGISGSTNCFVHGDLTYDSGATSYGNWMGAYLTFAMSYSTGDVIGTLTIGGIVIPKNRIACAFCGTVLMSDSEYSLHKNIHTNEESWSNHWYYHPYYWYDGSYSDTAEDDTSAYAIRAIYADSDEPVANAEITADGNTYITDENGIAILKQSPYISGVSVTKGENIIATETGFYATNGAINELKVHELDLDTEDFNFGNSGSENIPGPSFSLRGENSPIFNLPFSFDADFLKYVKLAYDAKDKTWQVLFGTSDDLEKQKDKGDADDDAWSEKFAAYKDLVERASTGDFNDALFLEKNKDKSSNLDLSAWGYLKIKADGELEITEGGVVVGAEYGVSGSLPVPSAPIIYFAYGASGSLDGQLSLTLENSNVLDSKLASTGEVGLGLELSAGVGAGLKKALSLEIGLKGNLGGTFKFPFESFKESFKAELNASFYALLSVLTMEWPYEKEFVNVSIYPEFNTEWTPLALSESDAEYVSRDYLNGISLFSTDSFKSNIYPYTEVETVTLSDGRVLMVWLDDNPERSDINRTSLYYSILTDGVWSEACEISSDGTADFEFSLSSYANTAALVWQNAKNELSDNATLEETAATVELCYAHFDGTSWGEPIAITDNNDYEYLPSVYAINSNQVYIAWVTNDTNNPFVGIDTTAETVYCTTIRSTNVYAPTVVTSDLERITEIAAGYNNTAIITDGDVYINSTKIYEGDAQNLGYNGSFTFSDGDSLYSVSGITSKLMCTPGANAVAINSTTVIQEVSDGFNSDLYASYYKDSAWTAPVKITDFGKKIRSWDAYTLSDGSLSIAAALADISTDSGEVVQSVSLNVVPAVPVKDIELVAIEAENVSRGTAAEFTLYVNNNTGEKIYNLGVKLAGQEVLYDQISYANIEPGETEAVKVRVSIPSNFRKQEITAEISSDIEQNAIDNNTATIEVGEANAEIVRFSINKQSQTARIIVKNSSCEDIENAVITLSSGDVIYSDSIALPAGKSEIIDVDVSNHLDFDEYRKIFVAEIDAGDSQLYDNSSVCKVYQHDIFTLSSDISSIGLAPGEAYKPTILPEDADLYILSSDESIATVADDGTITAVSNGTATISYMSPNATNSVNIIVRVRDMSTPVINRINYESYSYGTDISGSARISVDITGCLADGEEAVIVAKLYDIDGNLLGEDRENTSDNDTDYTLYVYAYDAVPVKAEVYLESNLPTPKPASYTASKEFISLLTENTSVRIKPGQSLMPKIIAYPPNTEVTLTATSHDEAVATVAEDGTITGVAEGDTTVVYTAESGATLSIRVYVAEFKTPIINSIEYEDEEYNRYVKVSVDTRECLSSGENATMIVAVYDSNGALITSQINNAYSTSNYTSYIFFEENTEPASVKVMIWGSLASLNPIAYVAEKQIQIIKSDISSAGLVPGGSVKPNFTTYPEIDNLTFTAVSADESIATVSEDGTITAVALGETVITYTPDNGYDSLDIPVYVREFSAPTITDISIYEYNDDGGIEIEMQVDTTDCLAQGEKATMITAVYDSKGTLLDISKHTANRSKYNFSYVQIEEGEPASVKVMLWNSLASMVPKALAVEKEIKCFTSNLNHIGMVPDTSVKPTFKTYPNLDNLTFTATSSNKNVATVSEDGTITAVDVGMATITYTPDNGYNALTIVVYVRKPGTPVIKSAVYRETSNKYGETFKGVVMKVDTTSCMEEDEISFARVSFYDENDELILTETSKVWYETANLWIDTNGVMPKKAKFVLTASPSSTVPTSYEAEAEITEYIEKE